MFIINKKEFGLFASALRTYYPREKILPNEQAMELWYNQLQDLPYNIAELTLNKWVATNKWSPSIADIREQAASITSKPITDWGEAWESVLSAVHRYGSYNEVEALESMDELTRRCVKRLGFLNICMSENIATERANFRMIYEQLEARAKQDNQIPIQLKEMIEATTEKLQIPYEKPKVIEEKQAVNNCCYDTDKIRALIDGAADKLGGNNEKHL